MDRLSGNPLEFFLSYAYGNVVTFQDFSITAGICFEKQHQPNVTKIVTCFSTNITHYSPKYMPTGEQI